MSIVGELSALGTALCWVGSSLAFAVASRRTTPEGANQFRLGVAVVVLAAIGQCVTGAVWPFAASGERVAWIAASGLAGLTLGDYGFFYALATIGPRLASVIMALWPACTVALNALCGVVPSAGKLAGIALTIAGVALVLARSRESAWRPDLTRRQWWAGVAGAGIGALGQAGGFVLAGVGMAPGPDLPDGVLPLHATIVRMVTAACGLQVILLLRRRPFALAAVVRDRRALLGGVLGAGFGPVAGVWLSMVARRFAHDAGVAAALMSTTPLFMLPIAIWCYGARVGVLGAVGTVIAVGGVVWCWTAP